jgi:hypothetical protein
VNRILVLLTMLALVIAPGTLVSAAVCRHHSAIEHELARSSADAKIASVARSEETAALLSKAGALSDTASGVVLADMLPTAEFTPPFPVAERLSRLFPSEDSLPGASVRPLLHPPAA